MESSNNLHTQTVMFISCYKDEFEFQLKVADRLKRYGIKSFFVTAHRNADAGSEDRDVGAVKFMNVEGRREGVSLRLRYFFIVHNT